MRCAGSALADQLLVQRHIRLNVKMGISVLQLLDKMESLIADVPKVEKMIFFALERKEFCKIGERLLDPIAVPAYEHVDNRLMPGLIPLG